MPLEKSKINKILVISLTNIGDVILTFPVIDILKENFPNAKISVVMGPKAETLCHNNPNFDRVFLYNKRQSPWKSFQWVGELRRQRFDLVVDLKNSAVPFFLFPRYRTSFHDNKSDGVHMKQKHLDRLKVIFPFEQLAQEKASLFVSRQDREYVDQLLQEEIQSERFLIIGPGAANKTKRWAEEGFAKLADQWLSQGTLKIVLIGDESDRKVAQQINKLMTGELINLCGRLTLPQLAHLIKQSQAVIVNDSAPMHLASYLDVPVIALFGPTDPVKYGPWSSQSKVVLWNDKDVDAIVNEISRSLVIKEGKATIQ